MKHGERSKGEAGALVLVVVRVAGLFLKRLPRVNWPGSPVSKKIFIPVESTEMRISLRPLCVFVFFKELRVSLGPKDYSLDSAFLSHAVYLHLQMPVHFHHLVLLGFEDAYSEDGNHRPTQRVHLDTKVWGKS